MLFRAGQPAWTQMGLHRYQFLRRAFHFLLVYNLSYPGNGETVSFSLDGHQDFSVLGRRYQ